MANFSNPADVPARVPQRKILDGQGTNTAGEWMNFSIRHVLSSLSDRREINGNESWIIVCFLDGKGKKDDDQWKTGLKDLIVPVKSDYCLFLASVAED